MSWLLRFLFWLDRVVNVILGGVYSETLSARAYRMDVKDQTCWGWTARAINLLFFWQPEHCRVQFERERANPLPPFQADKLIHFLGGWALDATLSPFMGYAAMAPVAGVAAAKELVWDKAMGRGTPDTNDFLATLAGGLLSQLMRFALLAL